MPSYIRTRSEFTINSFTTESQTAPTVATFADGGFVVAWVTADTSQDGHRSAIKAQLFDSAGSKVGAEFLVNSAANGQQFTPRVATLDNGNFLITWVTNVSDDGTDGIKAQLFNRSGEPIGSEFQVNATESPGGVFEPDVTTLADGRFVISWDDWGSVKAQIFNADGSRAGGILTLNTNWAEGYGEIIALASGGFVATWRTTTSNSWDVKAQIFNASGGKVGGEFLVNTVVAGSQNSPAATALAGGGFVITWNESNTDNRIKAQIYTEAGVKVGGELLVSTTTAYSMGGQVVTALPDGGFLIAWHNTVLVPGGGSDSEVKAQRFSASGVKVDGEFQINTLTTGSQWIPDLDTLADGRVIAVWASGSGDGSAQSVRAQILGTELAPPPPNSNPVIISNGGGTSVTLTHDEGVAAVTTVVASDDGDPRNLRYSITGGDDAGLFTINALTGLLSFRDVPDHVDGADNFYTVTVAASDGELTGFQTIQISLRHVNYITIVSDGGSDYAGVFIDENQTGVTIVAAVDDDGVPLTYSITGGYDADFFTIDSQTGELRFTVAPDYELAEGSDRGNVYYVQVTATDGTRSDAQEIAVYVNDVFEPDGFAIVSDGGGEEAGVWVPENSLEVTHVTVSGAAGPVTYEIVGGAHSEYFTIDPETGALSFIDPPDYEGGRYDPYPSPYPYFPSYVYNVIVRASDGVSVDEQDLQVIVEDVDEAPIFHSFGGETHVMVGMMENNLGAVGVGAEDPDAHGSVTYGLEGADADLFEIDSYNGYLSFRQALDYEAPADADGDNVYEVAVIAYSGALSATQAFSIIIEDEFEQVTITSGGGTFGATVFAPENGTAVTTVTATGDGQIYYEIVGGADYDWFALDPYTGVLSFLAAPDYEAGLKHRTPDGQPAHGNIYDVIVRAFNGYSSDDQRLSVQVEDVDEAPIFHSFGGEADVPLTMSENVASVATVFGSDPDRNQGVTYAIAGGADAALFEVDPYSGALRFGQSPDFEAPADADGDNVYQVTVALNSGPLSATQSFWIAIDDVNENVAITSNGGGDFASLSVAENGTAVTIVTAATGLGPVTYSIVGGADAHDFTIDASTGALAFASPPDFEGTADADGDNVFEVIVRADNGVAADEQSSLVDLTDVDEDPDFFGHEPGVIAIWAAENRAHVGVLQAYDIDGGAAIAYSVSGGADGALFVIDPVSGELSLLDAAGADFEAPADADGDNVYEVEVTATAGAWSRSRAFTVTVADEDEPLVITSNGGGTSAALAMAEGGTYVTTVVASDPDGAAPVYSIIGGPDAARFTIDSATGILSFADTPDFEAPADSAGANFYTVQVAASDGQHTARQSVQILVGNVNEGVELTSYDGADIVIRTIAENGQTGVQPEAADADGDALSWSITGGADAALFIIDPATGALSFVAAPDYEAPADEDGDNDYIVTVTASDGQYSDSQTFAFGIANVDEAVAITSNGGGAGAAIAATENGAAVTTVKASDADGGPVTYAIAGGADAARFAIDSATGLLAFVAAPNFEAPSDAGGDNVYDVVVSASDGTFTATQALAISVGNVNEAPVITSNGGGAGASIWVAENGRFVTMVAAGDPEGAVVYSIVGGSDASRFTINPQTWALQFAATPDHELPADANGDNVYNVVVQAGDGQLADTQALTVTVGNLRDGNNVTGTSGGDFISGSSTNPALRTTNAEDTVLGRDGHDTISGLAGEDHLFGDAGNDILIGGLGADRLTGGLGKDQFVFNSVSESAPGARDVITDFSRTQNDKINLSAIDANSNLVSNQAFTFIGSAAFSNVAGQLRFETSNGVTLISGDVNGDGAADFQIELSSPIAPVASDFVL